MADVGFIIYYWPWFLGIWLAVGLAMAIYHANTEGTTFWEFVGITLFGPFYLLILAYS